MFRLEFELCSFAELHKRGALSRLGRALDSEPQLKLERMDTHDPARRLIASAEAFLSDCGELLSGAEVLFERRVHPAISGEFTAPSYGDALEPGSVELPHRIRADMAEASSDWLLEEANLEKLAEWFGRVAAGFDAFYGYAADHQMARQQAGEFGRLRREKRWAPPPPGPESDRHSVRDVYWLNYFGPAYLEKWGDKLSGPGALGVRQLPTANGGAIILATPTPFVYEEDVASFMDYDWKRPWYEALGRDAFVNALIPAWNSKVPTREDHVRMLGAG